MSEAKKDSAKQAGADPESVEKQTPRAPGARTTLHVKSGYVRGKKLETGTGRTASVASTTQDRRARSGGADPDDSAGRD